MRSLGNMYDCQLHGSHLCDRNCRSREWSAAVGGTGGVTQCRISGRAFALAPPACGARCVALTLVWRSKLGFFAEAVTHAAHRKRSSCELACAGGDENLRKTAAIVASHDAKPGQAAWLRDQLAHAAWPTVTTPVVGDAARLQQWDCME